MSQKLLVKIPAGRGQYKAHEFDFYTFSKKVLGYNKLSEVHKEWCREACLADNRKLFLKPRGTYKSTIYTVAYPIWKLLHNPNERILIANATSENAEAFLREITSHFVRNERFISLFGKKIDPRAAKISSITFLNRTTYHKEPTISTIGVLGNLVSAHYSTIICDDLCNQQDRDSPSIRERKKKWFQDLLSILDPGGELIVVGTRWHFKDLYNYITEELNPKLSDKEKYFIRVESCYKDDGLTPAFPDILPYDALERLKIEKGPLEFASQYVNHPIPQESQIFFEEDFQTFKYLGSNKVQDNGVTKELDLVGYCDLALGKTKSSDFTCVATLGRDEKDGSVYLIDVFLDRVPPDRTLDVILRQHEIFHYRKFGVETNVFQSLFADNIKKASVDRQVYVPITEVNHRGNKELRIQSLQPFIKQGVLKIRDNWNESKQYKEMMNQFLYFPMYGHDDGPDAVEGAFSLLKRKGFQGKPFSRTTAHTPPVEGFTDFSMEKFNIPDMHDPSKDRIW